MLYRDKVYGKGQGFHTMATANTNRFTINNVTYTAKPFNFYMVTLLDKKGFKLSEIDKYETSLICEYFAICANLDTEDAAGEIEQHMINGGSIEEVANAMAKEPNDSDFFRAMANNAKANKGEETPESEKKSRKSQKSEAKIEVAD